jgi:hypothetical protein
LSSLFKGAVVNRYLSYYHPLLKRAFRVPLLHVRLRTATASLTTLGLVDSGATNTFVPTDLAEILGLQIDPKKATPSIGAGGGFDTVIFNLTIEVLKAGNNIATFADMPVFVPVNPEAIPYTVLGRDSVFLKFDITFRERIQRTILRPAKAKIKLSRYERRY